MMGTGGDAVVHALHALGVEAVFGIASIHNLPILDAIVRDGQIKIFDCRHEQNAVHAADGYSRVTGKLGVAITSTGPGAANAAGGLFEARFASSRVLMLTGQVESQFYMQGKAFLHEAESQMPMLTSLTRQSWSVRRTEDIVADVVAAGTAAMSGRPAPTAVEIPIDFQYAEHEYDEAPAVQIRRTTPDSKRIAQVAELLGTAKRPLIWAGGGVNHAGAADALRALVERLQIPVVTSMAGRGAVPEDHPLSVGPLITEKPVRELIADADVVVAIGTHFHMTNTGNWAIQINGQLAHIDADSRVFDRNYPTAARVIGDALLSIEALDSAVASTSAEAEWLTRSQEAGSAARDGVRKQIGTEYAAIMDAIRDNLPADGPVVRDATVPAYVWGNRLLPIVRSRTSIMPVSNAIGPGLPLSVGACVGAGVRTVVIHGDGGIMLSIGELATIAQYQLPLTVCVFNDKGYGILRKIQGSTFDGALHDVDLATPDFAALAESCGIKGVSVDNAADFAKVFAESCQSDGPTVIEIDMTNLGELMYGGKQRMMG
ncbi:acetolactate synthase-1/2/3 large subunit [Antricoccus suffuscus]|uniref:Acetolactate synthase-1/2/3 large subunit n=1 Tax=Antricoccus suffuscus TaxID=1629062 RepID=A0A2T1A2E0_9ACTN|nr:thiamine pyrophosphate-binding protein [Antricoccus suffuscus]PRZ42753.1 acetolactate synthase-1/2/3 large subunit [Antricoccus suffuscus]